ncbi:hypothetical protein A1O3_10512 [Capronia epimyces CBS 606.96]|uniref:Fungal N-terminal domain-containing protein n=1 Tax=Capronia epimyces CBS 606.96 TaxID=1182542 RepID=W9X8U2_9EURO|nr:uncharacterized protein A1O3_10512 [Capronia epimyces CBS 606.96]EXJ76867.1 hypothetical protein A1O3_10512 [Capronia epimyces CBS 606.96]
MAEVGLVASVFGIASLGASVSKALFDLGYTMRYAHEQIDEIAGEVTTFTSIIRQLGAVLKAQKGFFTDEAEKMVVSSMSDCKRLFRSIRRQIKRKEKSLVAFRWLFRKTKAEELKRRMDALRGLLGLMLQVMQIGRKVESDNILPDALSELREQVKMLKNEVLAYHRSLPKLQEAERSLQVLTRPPKTERDHQQHDSSPPSVQHPYWYPGYISPDSVPTEVVIFDGPHPQQEGYAQPLLSADEHHPSESDISESVSASATMEGENEKPSGATHTASSGDEAGKNAAPNGRRSKNEHASRAPARLTYRVSQRLITSMPYNPMTAISLSAAPARPTASNTQLHKGQESRPSSPDDEATDALKLLFGQWTKVDPRLIGDVLDRDRPGKRPTTITVDSLSQDSDDESESSVESESPRASSRSRSRHRPYPWPRHHDHPRQISEDQPAAVGWGTDGPLYLGPTRNRDAWLPPLSEEPPLAKVLATCNARFVWMHRNSQVLTYFADTQICMRYRLKPPNEVYALPERTETVLPKQWVLKEVIELFGFVCKEDDEVHWAIDKALTFVEVRQLVEVSSHLIEKNIRKRACENMENTSAGPPRYESSRKPSLFTSVPHDPAPRQGAGPLVAVSHPVDMQLMRVGRHSPPHPADPQFQSEEEGPGDRDRDKDQYGEETLSVFSSQIGYSDSLTLSLSQSNHTNQGGDSSSSVSRLAGERDIETGIESRRHRDHDHDRERARGSLVGRGKRREQRKTRRPDVDVQSSSQTQATDPRVGRRRHRDRKYS